MRVVKQGVDPDTVPRLGTCSHCKTVIEFLPSEAERVDDGRNGVELKITCPVCKRPMYTRERALHWDNDQGYQFRIGGAN